MEKKMSSMMIKIVILFGLITALSAADPCAEKKTEYENKLEAWKAVETRMKSIEITKAQYDELLPEYNKLWQESEKLKAEYLKCKDESENQHKALYNQGIQLKKDEKFQEALDKFVEALKIESDFEEAYEQAADVSAELDKYAEMEKYIEKIKSDEKKGKIYNKIGNKFRNSDPDKAIGYYEKMAKFYKPENAYYLIGVIYTTKKNEPAKAIDYYKRSLRIDPKDHKVYNALGASLVELSNLKTTKEEKDKLIDEAISVFLKGVELGPKGYRSYYELCVRLAQLYNIQGRAISALEYADKSIQYSRDKNYSLGHLERAIALVKMRKYEDAKRSLNIAKDDFLTRSSVEFWLEEIERLRNG
jgi:tetratricopeptide (TPR) repeat protein